jgi:hypothetical protein
MPRFHTTEEGVARYVPDPDHRGGFHGPRDHHDETKVNLRYRQWWLFDDKACDYAMPIEQMAFAFPVDPMEIP